MQIFINILLLAVGIVLLVKGADFFVDGASGIAAKLHVSEFIIGLTIVAFGTSAPELAVSISSAINGVADLTIGNIVGSNIANVLLILGCTGLVAVIPIEKKTLVYEIPFLVILTATFVLLGAFDGEISRIDGAIILVFLVAFVVYSFIIAKKERRALIESATAATFAYEKPVEEPDVTAQVSGIFGKINAWFDLMKEKTWFLVILTLAGLGAVVGGAQLTVDSCTAIAKEFGVPERIIGLTIVALGTSLPELITSVVAARKKQVGLAIGNVIGSNILNIALIVGLTATILPLTFTPAFVIDGIVALSVAVLLFIMTVFTKKLNRWCSALLLVSYVGYYVYIFVS